MTKEKSEYLYIPFTDEVQRQDDNKRRYSTGKFDYPDGGINVVSRYLRPSMGSCHDFCKYGEERALEMKARSPMPMSKKIMAAQGEGQEVEKVVTSAEKVKKSVVNIKPPPVPDPRKHDDQIVKEVVSSSKQKETTSSKQASLPQYKVDLSLERARDPTKREVSSSAPERTIFSKQVLSCLEETDALVKQASDPNKREVSSLVKKEAISPNHVLTPIKEKDVFMEHASDPVSNEASSLAQKDAISSRQDLMSLEEVDVFMNYASDPINKEVSSLTNEEAISSSQSLESIKEVGVCMKHANEPIDREVSSLAEKEATWSRQDFTPLEEVDVVMKHASNSINKEISSSVYKEALPSDQVLTPTMVEDVIMEHASDSFNKEELSSANKDSISSSQGLTPLEEVDVYVKHAPDPINKEVSSLAKKEANFSRQVSTPLKEVDVLTNHASDPFSKEVSSLANKEATSLSQDLTSIKEVDVYLKHANEPINEGVSSLAKKEAVLPRQVSRPLKKVGVDTKNPSDPKLKKTMKSNLSSVVMQRCSTSQAHGKIRKSKPTEHLSVNSPGDSIIKRKSEIKPRKDYAVSLSTRHSVKRPSRRKVENSNNQKGVSHLGNQKAVRKLKNDRSSSGNVQEKTLPAVDLIYKRKALRPVKKGIGATDSSSSHENRSLKREIHGIRPAELPPSSLRRNLRPTQAKVHTAQSPQSPSSPKTKVLTSNQLGTHVTGSTFSSPALPSAKGGVSFEHSKMESENGTLHSKKENNSMPRKGVTMSLKTVSLKDKSDPGRKLTFRRGKVIELQQEDITPRRLKFKPRLPVGNRNIEVDASRVFTLANKEGDASSSRVSTVARKEVGSKEASVTKTESNKITLRHRDLKGERDSNGLYNNVIEETVSKLVKTRPSKVKALVGAFESLITLQDTNLVTADAS